MAIVLTRYDKIAPDSDDEVDPQHHGDFIDDVSDGISSSNSRRSAVTTSPSTGRNSQGPEDFSRPGSTHKRYADALNSKTSSKRSRRNPSQSSRPVVLSIEKRALRRLTRSHNRVPDKTRVAAQEECRDDKDDEEILAFPKLEPSTQMPTNEEALQQTTQRCRPDKTTLSSIPGSVESQQPDHSASSGRTDNITGDARVVQHQGSAVADERPAASESNSNEDIEELEDQLELTRYHARAVELRMALRAAKRKRAENS